MKNLLKYLIVFMMMLTLVGCKNKVEANTEKNEEIITKETECYRSIMVSAISGSVKVTHSNGETVDAYEGLKLVNGDNVCVAEESNLTLDVDSDKHLFAEANTCFALHVEGTEENDKTTIQLEDGSVLCQIKEKLQNDDSFEIKTATSTMCVRGTVFRVSLINSNADNNNYELVEVYDGKVWSNINETNNEVTLEPGECALIKDDQNNASGNYVTDDQIDETFWNSSDSNMYVTKEEGTGNAVLKIAYNKLSSKVLDNLVTITESGQELVVEKEQLEQLNEVKKYEEAKKVEKLNENRGGAANEETICAEVGHTIILINGIQTCAICGRAFTSDYIPTQQEKDNAINSGIPLEIKFDFGPKISNRVVIETTIPANNDGGSNDDSNNPSGDEKPSTPSKPETDNQKPEEKIEEKEEKVPEKQETPIEEDKIDGADEGKEETPKNSGTSGGTVIPVING